MKKTLLFLLILGLVTSVCFAQKAPTAKKSGAFSNQNPREFVSTGYVEDIHIANPSIGQKSKIIIYSKDGNGIVFFVQKTTTIYDKNMNTIKLRDIPLKAAVKIRYRTDNDGFYEALSITSIEK